MLCAGDKDKWDKVLILESNNGQKKKNQENEIIEIWTKCTKEEVIPSTRALGEPSQRRQLLASFMM